jgi:hypothetical protein
MRLQSNVTRQKNGIGGTIGKSAEPSHLRFMHNAFNIITVGDIMSAPSMTSV